MGEVQEFKHACKFCNKSFPCGRSLGGHMRSHLTNNSTEKNDHEKLMMSSKNNTNGGISKFNTETTSSSGLEGANGGYGLRENPKKTWRFADIIPGPDETSSDHHQILLDNSNNKLFCCKECGKCFQSWKALFGHMKSHSTDRERERACLEEQDSSLNSANQVKLVMDSQSDNETTAPSRKKKKKRRSQRRTRYNNMGTACNNTNQNNASSSVSEIDQQEQEEVAMCLMMLSRDHGGGLKSVAESSDNFSEFSKSQTSRVTNTAEIFRPKRESENFGSGNGKSWSKINRTEVSSDGVLRKEKILSDQFGLKKLNSSKRNGNFGAEFRSDPDQIGKNPTKRSKFECTTCSKTFHSYQALGGHRASHKKTKGCFASTIESSENSIETDEENKPRIHQSSNESLVDHDMPLPLALVENNESKSDQVNTTVTKKSKGHECPICLKVFPSGQALGGHKRSHLIAGGGGGSDAKTNSRPAATAAATTVTVVAEKPMPEIRDLLDLNLPAPDEEDSNGHVNNASLEPWWTGSSHKHEALVGLISN